MSSDEQAVKSSAACDRLWSLPAFQQAVNLFIYVNYRSELATIALIERCFMLPGRRVTVPLTIPKEGLEAYLIKDVQHDLAPGYCAIPEPVIDRVVKFDPAKIDVVVLPGSVFDLQGGRLGYGGGYYDRFLANDAPQAIKIGIAYEMQLVEEVPLLPHDQSLDYLVTEKRVVKI